VLAGRVEELGAAADVQMQAVDSLQQAVERVYTAERVRFRGGLEDGELFGGEVLIRWQELVGSEHVSMLMGTAAPVGRRAAGVERAVDGPLREALVTAVGQAVRVALDRAARRTAEEWELILGAPLVMHGAATVSEHGTSAVGQHGRSTAEERGAGTAEQETRRAADGTDRHAIVGTRAATEARAAAANWLDRLPGAIRDQARARRASRAAVGPGARGAALLLGVAAVAGRTDSTEPSAAAAHGLVRALFGPDDAARLLAVARIGLRDAGAALLERSADGCRAHIAGYGLTQRLPDELREALSEVRKKL
jgi:hypothetical protein